MQPLSKTVNQCGTHNLFCNFHAETTNKMIRVRIVVVRRLNGKYHWKATCCSPSSYCRLEFVAFAIWAYTVSDKISRRYDNRYSKWVTNLLAVPREAVRNNTARYACASPTRVSYRLVLSGFRRLTSRYQVLRFAGSSPSIIKHYSWRPQSHKSGKQS